MERRTFMKSSVAGFAAAAAGSAVGERGQAADAKAGGPELYELRAYSLKPAKLPMLDDYLSKAYLPAVKRAGAGPVGVFTEKVGEELKVHVLVVHHSAESVIGMSAKIAADAEHAKAGADYLAATAADPIYGRIESSILSAIGGMPKMERPDATKPRLLNLRVYESHNERAGKKKIEMFEKAELALFRRVGLTPVFFAEAIAGALMPNLTYMLVFPDDAGRQAAWNKFRTDPEWLKLKAVPEYADKEIVLKVTNKLLTPAAYSEI
jgi:hypothetical protein